jgi:hypothetical protein
VSSAAGAVDVAAANKPPAAMMIRRRFRSIVVSLEQRFVKVGEVKGIRTGQCPATLFDQAWLCTAVVYKRQDSSDMLCGQPL